MLALQIDAQAHRRQGKAQTSFPATLPPPDSDMAVQVFKDPYLFDFLGTDAPRREAELEPGLVAHIQNLLRVTWQIVGIRRGAGTVKEVDA